MSANRTSITVLVTALAVATPLAIAAGIIYHQPVSQD